MRFFNQYHLLERNGKVKRISSFIDITALFHYISCAYRDHIRSAQGISKTCNDKIHQADIQKAPKQYFQISGMDSVSLFD